MVGIRRDRVRKAVTRHIGQTHAPVRIAADVDRCCPREGAIPATPEQPDGPGRPVVDQKIRVAIGVEVVQSNGMRVRRDGDAESRMVPAFEGPSGDPEEDYESDMKQGRNPVDFDVRESEAGKGQGMNVRT